MDAIFGIDITFWMTFGLVWVPILGSAGGGSAEPKIAPCPRWSRMAQKWSQDTPQMAQDDPAWPMKLSPRGPQRTPQRPEFINIIASLRKHLHDMIFGITFVINLTAVLGPVKRREGPRIPKRFIG